MNIGLLITRFPPDVCNGAELQMKQVAEQLARRGHDVTVFTRRYHGRPFRDRQDGYLIRRRRELPVPGLRTVWDTLPALWQIACQRPRRDVLLCYQTFNSGLIGVIAQALLGIPAVVSVRGNDEYRLDYTLANRLFAPTVYRQARRIAVQSPLIRDDLIKQLAVGGKSQLASDIKPKLAVVPNGIGLAGKPNSAGNKIVYVGRLIEKKGVADLLEAARTLDNARITIVGAGPERPRLQSLARGLSVEFVGRVSSAEVLDHLRQARVLVLPSRLGDGMPNVVLEAMACGVPVITTRTAAMPDIVRHETTGLLYEPADVQQLTSHLQRLLRDDDLWRRLGERSRVEAGKYSWDVVTPQIEKLLEDACGLPTPETGEQVAGAYKDGVPSGV